MRGICDINIYMHRIKCNNDKSVDETARRARTRTGA